MPRTAEEYAEQSNKGTIRTMFPESFDKLSPGEQLPPRFFALMPDRGTNVRRSSKTGGTGRPGGTDGFRGDQFLAEEIYKDVSNIHKEYLREGAFKSPMVLFGDDAVYLGVYKDGKLIGHVFYEDIRQYLDGDTSVVLDEKQFYAEAMESFSDYPAKGLPKEALDIYMKGEQAERNYDSEYLNSEASQFIRCQMSPYTIGWVPGLLEPTNMYHQAYRDARQYSMPY